MEARPPRFFLLHLIIKLLEDNDFMVILYVILGDNPFVKLCPYQSERKKRNFSSTHYLSNIVFCGTCGKLTSINAWRNYRPSF